MFEENATAMMLILMSSTGRGTIHLVRSEDGRRGNWIFGDYGLNGKKWAKEMDYIVSANVFVLNSKKRDSNIVRACPPEELFFEFSVKVLQICPKDIPPIGP
jgi:hypothetical protein